MIHFLNEEVKVIKCDSLGDVCEVNFFLKLEDHLLILVERKRGRERER